MKEWGSEPDGKDRRLRLEFAVLMAVQFLLAVGVAVLALSSFGAFAHPGRTAADGCHNDRQNGGRHCHGGSSSPPPQRSSGGSVYYPNCAAARAAGAAPVRRGQPGYGPHLDRDNDGIGCE